MAAVDDDRGQLLLAAGLAIAVALVAVALVLNSAIYTENLATRNGDIDANGGVSLTRDVRTDGGDILYTVNREAPFGYTSLNTRYGLALDDWVSVQQRGAARDGRSVAVAAGSREFGTRIRDDDSTTTLEPLTGGYDATSLDQDWAVVQDAKVRRFELAVNPASTSFTTSDSGAPPDDVFFIDIRDGSNQWQIVPYDDGGSLGIYVYDAAAGTAVGTCTPGVTGEIDIDVTAGTVDGMLCQALDFVDSLGGTQNVYFAEADEGVGSYELIVDRVQDVPSATTTGYPFESVVDAANYDAHCEGPTYASSTGSSPYAVPALYSADVSTTFRTDRVTYENDVRVAPEEPGDRTRAPRIIRFDVDDISGSTDAEFTVEWTALDPDGASPSVTVNLYDTISGALGSPVDSTSTSGTTLVDSGGDGGDYTLEIVVTDSDGNTRRIAQEHTDDEDGNGDGSCPE